MLVLDTVQYTQFEGYAYTISGKWCYYNLQSACRMGSNFEIYSVET